MVWPTLGSRTAKEQKHTHMYTYLFAFITSAVYKHKAGHKAALTSRRHARKRCARQWDSHVNTNMPKSEKYT